ncbi:hypothetical protein BJY14_001108 [Actinomadura luteofluorescens]|uniref:Uncharacterized protein n=1 Tax=Actinomadura luteofluorescens TaxID=46163 RepID=A0A7Y9ED08_9ACTN|nr:hypothetical protein [Actinomadura luteofluorescens]
MPPSIRRSGTSGGDWAAASIAALAMKTFASQLAAM